MKCEICSNYMTHIGSCKFCHFEYCQRYTDDDWDILEQDFELEIHKEIQRRLYAKGIDCICADIYGDYNIAYLIGCWSSNEKIARALGVDERVVYGNNQQGLVIINLFEEKYLRGEIDEFTDNI